MLTQSNINTITNRLTDQSGYSISYERDCSIRGLTTHIWRAIDSGLSPILTLSYGEMSGTLPKVGGYRYMLPNNHKLDILSVLQNIDLQVGFSKKQ